MLRCMDMTISPEVLVCISLFYGGLCAALAKRRGRHPVLWFGIGLIGFIGFAILAFLPHHKAAPTPQPEPKLPAIDKKTEYNWYYITQDKETVGPLSAVRFEELKGRGVITESTYVWNESMSDWKKLGELAKESNTSEAPEQTPTPV